MITVNDDDGEYVERGDDGAPWGSLIGKNPIGRPHCGACGHGGERETGPTDTFEAVRLLVASLTRKTFKKKSHTRQEVEEYFSCTPWRKNLFQAFFGIYKQRNLHFK